MRIFIPFFMLCTLLFSGEILTPYKVIEAHANVISSALINNRLYLGTDSGRVDIYDLQKERFLEPIVLPRVKTHFTDNEFAKVFSIDELAGKLMVLSETSYGKRILHIFEDVKGKRTETLSIHLENESIKKALFLDENTVLIGSLSNDIYFMDLRTQKITFSHKFSIAALSDFELSEDRSTIALGCESGIVYLFDHKNRKVLQEIQLHKDNMYDIDYKQGAIISGGVDRHAGVFTGSTYMMKSDFLVYAVALNKNASIGAFMSDEQSDIDLFDTQTRAIIARIKTEQSTLNGLHFLSDSELISVAYEKKVKFWRFL